MFDLGSQYTDTKTPKVSSDEKIDLMSETVLGESEDALTVDGPEDANRLLGALQAIERKIERLEGERDAIVKETENFYNKKINALESRHSFLEGKIKAYVNATEESVSVPNGKAYTMERTKWEWKDDEALQRYAEENCPDAITTTTKVNKNTLKKHLKENEGKADPVAETEPYTITVVSTS